MTDSIKQQFEVYSNALRIRNNRNEILASNIANAATPNFKARDLDFEVELAKALSVGPLKTSKDGHIALASKNLPGKVQYRKPLHPSMDGNTVEISVEQAKYGKAAAEYQASLRFIESRVSGIRRALKGE